MQFCIYKKFNIALPRHTLNLLIKFSLKMILFQHSTRSFEVICIPNQPIKNLNCTVQFAMKFRYPKHCFALITWPFRKEAKNVQKMFSTAASSAKSRPDLSTEGFPPNPSDFSRRLVSFSLSSHPWPRILGRSSIAGASHSLKEP